MIELNVRPWINGAPFTIAPKDNLRRARALMRTAHMAELLVVDDGKLVGMLSERDIWEHCPKSAIMLDEKQADELLEQIRIGGVMTLHPPVVTPETSLREALHLFAQTGRHGLPVVEKGVLVGLLTQERILQAMAAVLSEIEQRTA
jgi:acetoin utilization protein AcuB